MDIVLQIGDRVVLQCHNCFTHMETEMFRISTPIFKTFGGASHRFSQPASIHDCSSHPASPCSPHFTASISPCLHPGLLILHAGSAVETGTDSVAAIWAIYPHLGAISPHLSSANLSLKDGSAINCISLVFLSWSRNLVAARFLPLFSLLHPPQWVDPPHPLVSFLTEQYPPTCSQHLHLQMWIMQIYEEIISGSSTLT